MQVYNEAEEDNDEMFAQSSSSKLSEKHHKYKENEKHASQWVGRTVSLKFCLINKWFVLFEQYFNQITEAL